MLRSFVLFAWKLFLLVFMKDVPYYIKELGKLFQTRIVIFDKSLLASRNQVKCHRNIEPLTVFVLIQCLKNRLLIFSNFCFCFALLVIVLMQFFFEHVQTRTFLILSITWNRRKIKKYWGNYMEKLFHKNSHKIFIKILKLTFIWGSYKLSISSTFDSIFLKRESFVKLNYLH